MLSPTAPSHGRCNQTDRRSRSRRTTCHSPELVAARGAAAAVPILWSQPLVAARRRFVNEEPFDAKHAFTRYLSQLPESSSFGSSEAVRRHWKGACDHCTSCAVVGASGTLLKHEHGTLIDSHAVVLRPNWLKLKGYKQHTGTRTTLNIIFALENMVDQFIKSQRRLAAAQRAVGLVTPSSKRSLNSMLRYLGRMKYNKTHGLHKPRADDAPLFLLSDAMWMRATNHLCARTLR